MSSVRSFVDLTGDTRATGRWIGRAARGVLRARVRALRGRLRKQKIPDRTVHAAVRDFARLVEKLTPHWLDEAGGLAQGAELTTEDILLLNSPPPEQRAAPPHCTGFVRVSKRENALLKIRDERNRVQQFLILRGPDGTPLQGGRDIGNLGLAHAVSTRGLAGGNHTGSHTDRVPERPYLDDCHLLRYLVERAGRVRDIPRLFDRLADASAAGGAGPDRGSIFLFVDAREALLLETAGPHAAYKFLSRGTHAASNHYLLARARTWATQPPNKNTRRRYERMRELLKRARNRPGIADVFGLTRDRKYVPHALCNDDQAHFWMTISAQYLVLDREDPQASLNWVCCGNTRHSVFLPVPLAERRTYRPLADGRFYRAADRLYRSHRCDRHLAAAQRSFERRALADPDYGAQCTEAFDLVRGA